MTQHVFHTLPPTAFYDAAASTYDTMTAFAERVPREASVLKPLADRFGIRSAADMGCGTGIHVCALSSLGITSTGYDISHEMLQRARSNAASYPGARFVAGDFTTPELLTADGIDAVFCLGNSIPHIESADELAGTLEYWHRALNSRGRVIIQLLNYDRILAARERIVAVRVEAHATIVRFYDFTEPRITFNILTIDTTGQPPRPTLHSTLLRPFTAAELREAAHAAGFVHAHTYASLALDQWTPASRDTVLVLETS